MKKEKIEIAFTVYDSIAELPQSEKTLLEKARTATADAYAPYSQFHVGAAALLANGEILTGSNQENAAFPAGLCAERVLLSAAASLFPKVPVKTIAISYKSDSVASTQPIAPCGICRQSLQEVESRSGQPIEVILSGMEGPVYVLDGASKLLPLAFTSEALG